MNDYTEKILKYVLEGLAVAAAAYYIPRRNLDLQEIALIGLTAAVALFVLDTFAPSVGTGARMGAGFGIGMAHVGAAREGFAPMHFDKSDKEMRTPHVGDETCFKNPAWYQNWTVNPDHNPHGF